MEIRRLFVLFSIISSVSLLHAQEAFDDESFALYDQPVFRVLDQIASEAGIKLYYDPQTIPFALTSVRARGKGMVDLFSQALAGTTLQLVKFDSLIWIAGPERLMSRDYAERLIAAWESGQMRSPDDTRAPLMVQSIGSFDGQTRVSIEGRIIDRQNSEALLGATLIDLGDGNGTATDASGFFQLSLDTGVHNLELSLLGYISQPIQLNVKGPVKDLEIPMQSATILMSEVLVTAQSEAEQRISNSQGISRLDARELNSLPTLGGEMNVFASLSAQSGVAQASEGSASFSVRGGGLDQNLVLQGGMPLLYPAHALGFFPIFHPDRVSGVTLYKGYIPAEYGERASSVVDVEMRNGNMERWSMRGSAGFISSRLAVDGPIIKKHLSVLASGRGSHVNWLLPRLNNGTVSRSRVSFQDFGLRLHGVWDGGGVDADLSYAGDAFLYNAAFGYDYENYQGGLAFRQNLGKSLIAHLKISQSEFNVDEFELRRIPGEYDRRSGLRQRQAIAKVQYFFSPEIEMNFGAGQEQYISLGREQQAVNSSGVESFSFEDPDLRSTLAFTDIKIELDRLRFEGGLRLSHYQSFVPQGPIRTYPGLPGATEPEILEEAAGSSNRSLGGFIQPRASLTWESSSAFSTGIAFSRLTQPVHQLSPTISPTPADLFFVATEHIPVTTSNLWSVQISSLPERSKSRLGFDFSTWIRLSEQLLQARDGNVLRNSPLPEMAVYQADGRAYGVDVGLKWKGIRNAFNLSYGYARSLIAVNRDFPEMRFTDRSWLPTLSDMPHQVDFTMVSTFSSRASFNFNWSFLSGRAFTPTDASVPTNGIFVPVFVNPQSARLPPTHRFDAGFTLDNSAQSRKGFLLGFSLSIYNIYMRDNPFLVFYRPDFSGRLRPNQFALIGEAIPALNLNFQWK